MPALKKKAITTPTVLCINMSRNKIIQVNCFDQEIGRLGFDPQARKSFFQYNPDYLKSGAWPHLFPLILKRMPETQVFSKYSGTSFNGLPPMFADSLPDAFGNTIFKVWLNAKNKDFKNISILEQLAYVSNRGMGALEYYPAQKLPKDSSIVLDEIIEVLKLVLDEKTEVEGSKLNSKSLLNVFKIGTSAGGVRPKILISEHLYNGQIIPGDITVSADYKHFLVKLNLEEDQNFPREQIEYLYYLTAVKTGIQMMPSQLIEGKHFATQRFDRQEGKKVHVLTASGLSGWDYKSHDDSSYENLFDLAFYLKLNFKEIEELFLRMVFNVVFANYDDHLKNHSFLYNQHKDKWQLSPAYDLSYSLNPMLHFNVVARALSINNKRVDIQLQDLLSIAEKYTIKNPKGIIRQVQGMRNYWKEQAQVLGISVKVIANIEKAFCEFPC